MALKKQNSPIAIVMGSDSDLPTMQQSIKIVSEFGLNPIVKILSAHRTPKKMYDFAENAHKLGVKVIIAGAGGSAHLPGMIAALTPLPVIGVPIKSKYLNGIDSLYSIVQMPKGIPVATVAIEGGTNAGLLAIQILSTLDQSLQKKMLQYRESFKKIINIKNEKLSDLGANNYLKEKN